MNGVLLVNKPQGFTSFDVVAKLRGILREKRIGHGGTLDPMATGVLPVFVGTATKACDIVPDPSKAYRAGFRLGLTTDTLDITGEVTAEYDRKVTQQDVMDVLPRFTGDIKQVPPMYSAIKINGQKLCNLARQGIEVERPARDITIDRISLESFDEAEQSGVISVECSKGTYIRSLIDDIGNALGCGGVMTSLVRTRACGYSLEDCAALDEIQQLADEGRAEELFRSVETVFGGLAKLRLNEVQTRMYRNGVKLDLERVRHIRQDTEQYAVYGCDGGFIGVAAADFENGVLRVFKNFI